MRHFYSFIILILILSGCSSRSNSCPGYIEGEYTYISSALGGMLFTLNVTRGQSVSKGQLLFKLDDQPQRERVNSLKATHEKLKAELDFATAQFERMKKLFSKNAVDKARLDRAETDYRSQFQNEQSTLAELKEAEWGLQQKTRFAPVSGEVFDTFFRVGEGVEPNKPVLAILSPANINVLFYIPEAELSQIYLGKAIQFDCDGCKNKTIAYITYISPEAEYTPPVIYSKSTRYKLVYLVRASIEKDAARFHPGQPIDVYIS